MVKEQLQTTCRLLVIIKTLAFSLKLISTYLVEILKAAADLRVKMWPIFEIPLRIDRAISGSKVSLIAEE